MDTLEYLNQKREIQSNILDYIDNESELSLALLNKLFKEIKFNQNPSELKETVLMLSSIIQGHHRSSDFFKRIEKIILLLIKDIKKIMSASEIYDIFQNSKQMLLFFIESNIISIDEFTEKSLIMNNFATNFKNYNFLSFFLPEIRGKLEEWRIEQIERNVPEVKGNPPNVFDEKRRIGENDTFIAQVIRKDEIEDFVSYVTQSNLNLDSNIPFSSFESNPLLNGKDLSLIEYATFCGSIQIFQYLRLNNIKLKPSLWIYAIHSDNSDIIHLLEENEVVPEDKSYKECFYESVKCHNINLSNYFLNNYFNNENNEICEYSFKYYNFLVFPDDMVSNLVFFYCCEYNCFNFVKLLLKEKEIDVNKMVILNQKKI